MSWSSMEEAIAAFRRGEFVMVMDSDDREDECDLCWAAETTTAEQMAFAIRHTTGIVCVAVDRPRLDHFGLHPATMNNTDSNATAFHVATDFLPGTTTGVSAADRAVTARALCDMSNKAEDFSKPGHLFPLCPRAGGVIERPGHTESTYDLCRLSGLNTVGLLAELMHEDGTMFRRSESLEFAKRHGFAIIHTGQLIEHRKRLQEEQALSPKKQQEATGSPPSSALASRDTEGRKTAASPAAAVHVAQPQSAVAMPVAHGGVRSRLPPVSKL